MSVAHVCRNKWHAPRLRASARTPRAAGLADPPEAAGALASSVRRRGLAPAAEPQADQRERKRRPAATAQSAATAVVFAAVEARTAACRAQQGSRPSLQSGAASAGRSDAGAKGSRGRHGAGLQERHLPRPILGRTPLRAGLLATGRSEAEEDAGLVTDRRAGARRAAW
jgi:hypothetical protein